MTEKNSLLQTLLLPLVLLSGQVYGETWDLALTPNAPTRRLLGEAILGNSTNRTWNLSGPPGRRLHLNCTGLTLLKSADCSKASLYIFENGKEKKICYRESTVYSWESEGNRLTVQIQSEPSSSGGRVSCDISLLEGSPLSAGGDSGDYMDRNVPNNSKASSPSGGTDRKRIIGGEVTEAHAFPFMAAILICKNHFEMHCGGTILTHRHVLTDAHCTIGQHLHDLYVAVGIHDLSVPDSRGAQMLTIIQTYLHPEHTLQGLHDLAVLLLHADIGFNNWVQPVKLPERSYELLYHEVTALGWGETEPSSQAYSTVLRAVFLGVVELRRCIHRYGHLVFLQNQIQICTLSQWSDTCELDRGGPLIIWDPTIQQIVQVGLITDKNDCVGRIGSHLNTAVFPYLEWLGGIFRQNLPNPSNPNVQPTCQGFNQ